MPNGWPKKPITKQDLINQASKDTGVSKATAEKVINSILRNIKDELGGSRRITLVGFGTFSVEKRSARKGRNPQTGKMMSIHAKRVVNKTEY